ncbi:MAG: protein TolR [Proteobacteria bacterium]|jgi:biopolymer transport protein TolR|nr:MAG: protein TolR [Pseudomonadota bacterium]
MGASLNINGGGGGRRRRTRSHVPMSEINVTPFVDVMLVLLIIFMVAAPLLTSGVPLELPQAKGNQLEAQDKEPVVVSVTSDGKLFLGQEDKTPIPLDELGPKLKVIAESRGGMDEPIFVRGDRSVEYGTVARVMARIKEAGFRKLSLVTEVESGG